MSIISNFNVAHSNKRLLCLVTYLILSNLLFAQNGQIRINQLGYYPQAPKLAIVVDAPATSEFHLINSFDEIIYTGDLGREKYWEKSEEQTIKADFSKFTVPGLYRLKVGELVSSSFEIGQDVWRAVAISILKSYYLQRASFELTEEFAGKYKRPAGHPDTHCVFHTSSGREGLLTAPAGWYDAGDFGKYIVSAGVTLGNMMSLIEIIPGVFPDGSTNIPESGNGINDLLDEVKYELDWFKYMQDSDGGVFVKITSEKYPDMMLPHLDPLQRNVYGKSTAATLHFAATMAMASRLFKNINADWSNDCLDRAESAWSWAIQHQHEIFENPDGVLSGAYSNSDMSDEFLWAAVELFNSTRKDKYKQYMSEHIEEFNEMDGSGWADVSGLAVTSLAVQDFGSKTIIQKKAIESLVSWSDDQIEDIDRSAYGIPDFKLVWGSNGFIAAKGLALIYAYKITNEKKYLHGAAKIADYILGKNATGYCFVTGFGSKRVKNLHHSVSIADGIEGSLPGFVPGGPNPSMPDAESHEHGEGLVYDHHEHAKAYMDDVRSYASNENDICYSSPVLALLAALDYYFGEEYPENWDSYNRYPE